MKLIKSYVRRYMAHHVVEALKELKVPRLSAVHVESIHKDEVSDVLKSEESMDSESGRYTQMMKLELICDDERVEMIKKTILEKARTGYKGDGVVVIAPVEEIVSIRTGEIAAK